MAKLEGQGCYPEIEFDETKYLDDNSFYVTAFMADQGIDYLTSQDLRTLADLIDGQKS